MKSAAVRILHTADNHLGISYAQYPDRVMDRLVEERFQALERLVEMANAREAHFFVVAGDPQQRNAQIPMIQRRQMMNKIDDVRSDLNDK